MGYFLIKVIVTGVIVAAVSELARRSTVLAAVLASLPLTSLLAILWLYHDTQDGQQAALLAENVFWALIPSFLFFFSFPLLMRAGWRFSSAMTAALLLMIAGYLLYTWVLNRLGIRF